MADLAKPTPKKKRVRTKKASATKSTEKAGIGTPEKPVNKRVPDHVLIKRDKPVSSDMGLKVTDTPEVQGDKTQQIIDILNGRPVHVSLIPGTALTPDRDGRLVFIEGPVSNDLKSVFAAKALFAVKKDGTVIYNPRGFDEAAAGDFDMLDIVKLIDHNNKK